MSSAGDDALDERASLTLAPIQLGLRLVQSQAELQRRADSTSTLAQPHSKFIAFGCSDRQLHPSASVGDLRLKSMDPLNSSTRRSASRQHENAQTQELPSRTYPEPGTGFLPHTSSFDNNTYPDLSSFFERPIHHGERPDSLSGLLPSSTQLQSIHSAPQILQPPTLQSDPSDLATSLSPEYDEMLDQQNASAQGSFAHSILWNPAQTYPYNLPLHPYGSATFATDELVTGPPPPQEAFLSYERRLPFPPLDLSNNPTLAQSSSTSLAFEDTPTSVTSLRFPALSLEAARPSHYDVASSAASSSTSSQPLRRQRSLASSSGRPGRPRRYMPPPGTLENLLGNSAMFQNDVELSVQGETSAMGSLPPLPQLNRHVCGTCGRGFTRPSALVTHKLSHVSTIALCVAINVESSS